MRNRPGSIVFALALAGLISSQASPSLAQARIGSASSISNQVEGINRNVTRTLAVGGEVFSNEQVRTGEQSTAQLVFLDNTNLNVGPKSTVTLNVPQTSVTVFASGRVEGPVAWHGSIIETASNWQFPLVGGGVCPFGLSEFDTCLPAPSKVCQWGKTASGMCVNNRLAEITQTGTLVYSQLGVNHNFSPYVPANPTAEKDYPIPVNHFFELFFSVGF